MEQRNMLIAFALSMIVLLGWQELFPDQAAQPETQQVVASKTASKAASEADNASPAAIYTEAQPPAMPAQQNATGHANTAKVTGNVTAGDATADDLISEQSKPEISDAVSNGKFEVGNNMIHLKISDKGWITQGSLLTYKKSIEPDAPNVDVLFMDHNGHAVYANSGIIGVKRTTPFVLVKQAASVLTLQSQLEGGRIWQRTFSLDPGSYKIDIHDKVTHGAGLKMYRQVVERNPNKKLNTFYEHMGPTALINGKLEEPDYDDLVDKGAQRKASVGGWTGVMHRYFIAALISNPKQNHQYYFKGDGSTYQAGVMDAGKLEGSDAVFSTHLYIGPKSIPILKEAGSGLERSVDFGLVAPISKPMHSFLSWLYGYLGNYGWCIIVLVLSIKLLFFYPTQKSYESMAGMRKLQPEMTRLKDLYGDDKQRMSQEMMALYKKHKVNPMGGCLPIIIQIPVFFSLYKVLLISIEMRQAPFIGWIHDMSVQDPYFVLPVIMGASMLVQQRLNPKPPDPMQAKVMQFLPVIFTGMFLFFPAGLVLYWVVNNILSIVQQRLVMKRMNVD